MLCEAASQLAVPTLVLAERSDDAACPAASGFLTGHAHHAGALGELSERCAAVTFDHEQVDLELLSALEDAGHTVAPPPSALRFATDKAQMRQRLADAGLPVPTFTVLPEGPADPAVIEAFGTAHGWPLVLKAARGGYDGRGVWVTATLDEAMEVARRAEEVGTQLLLEPHVDIQAELAQLVVRAPSGEAACWPAVETVQVDGVCREVLFPGRLGAPVASEARQLGLAVAELTGVVGILAVELFATAEGLVVNELAMRPHNSGHWSIEGAVTSQFENHLRAVLGLPLGSTEPASPFVACVNVFGDQSGSDPRSRLAGALAVEGAHIHLYGKTARPGRKLGHVTVVGDDQVEVVETAWKAATALGTPRPPRP